MRNPNTEGRKVVRHPYIHIAHGGKFYPSNPTPAMFSIRSIAYGLAKECRFAGQIESFYCVTQHSLLMRDYALQNDLCKPSEAIYFDLHDGGEGYLGDIAKPIKVTLPDFNRLEEETQKPLMEHFGLNYPLPSIVKELDNRILVDEATQLFENEPDWLQDFKDANVEPLGIKIEPWTWQQALWYFTNTFYYDYRVFLEGQGVSVNKDYAYFKWQDYFDLEEKAFHIYFNGTW